MSAALRSGTLVVSAAGHDKGRLYIVLRTEDGFAYAADGKHCGLNNPKKKSIRHIKALPCETDAAELLCDAHIRKAIKQLKTGGGCYLG